MYEWYEKYSSYPRSTTLTAFDKPILIFLGLTLTDFIAGVVGFLIIIMAWDSLLAIPIAISFGVFVSWVMKFSRKRFPAHFLMHYSWSKGLAKIRGFPTFFRPNQNQIIFRP